MGGRRPLSFELVMVALIDVRRWWALVARCGGTGGRASPVIVRVKAMVGARRRLWVLGTRGPLLRCWRVCVARYCSSNVGGGHSWPVVVVVVGGRRQ